MRAFYHIIYKKVMLCIIAGGIEGFPLIKICQQLSISYAYCLDNQRRPYEEKTLAQRENRTHELIETLYKKGYTTFILSPIIELTLLQEKARPTREGITIIPLYTKYIQHIFAKSRIGMLGLCGGYTSIKHAEQLLQTLIQEHTLTDKQKETKRFHYPFALRKKVMNSQYILPQYYSNRSYLMNKTLKKDLQYCKDANVDSVIPLDYSFFLSEKMISKYFNQKKQSFYNTNILKELLSQEKVIEKKEPKEALYLFTGGKEQREKNSKRKTLIANTKDYKISIEEQII